jgi:hypothetical protein
MKTLALLVLGIAGMAVIADIYVRIVKHLESGRSKESKAQRQDREYNEQYALLEEQIKLCKLTALSESLIRCDLKRLAKMPGNNKEMTGKLTNDYLKRFYGSDEFSPDNLDVDRISKELRIANESRI